MIETDDADGGWVDTHHYSNLVEQVEEMTLNANDVRESKAEKTKAKSTSNDESDDEDEDEEAGDMDEFMADEIEETDNKVSRERTHRIEKLTVNQLLYSSFFCV